MDERIKNLLNEEISAEIQALSSLATGSKEKSVAIEDLAVLYKLRIEESKLESDADDKYNRRVVEENSNTRDEEFKRVQLNEQVKDRYFKLGMAAADLILPLIFYGVWMRRGFRFEEKGTFTSTTFRGLFTRFRPTKK